LFLNSISVSNFRNILSCELNFNSRVAVFVGQNGQGKTSLLEAIYLLSHSKSFRTNRSTELISKLAGGPTEATAILDTADGTKNLSYRYQNSKREVFINGNKVTSASQFYGTAKVIDFTPDDLFLVKGSPSERRRFIDKILAIVDKEYLESLVRYQRALKNRNALLINSKPSQKLQAELALWEAPLIENGKLVSQKRAQLIALLSLEAGRIYSKLAQNNELFEVNYKSHFTKELDQASEYQKRYNRDLKLKTTSFGVHRDELEINLNSGFGMSAAKEIASQGQTRSVALALKLAGIECLKSASFGEDPIVLLDDVESELDQKRRSFLLEYLIGIKSQIFIATTNRDALPGLEKIAQFFTVQEGIIAPM